MLPQYIVRSFWGDFSESPHIRCSGGVGLNRHGEELKRPGLAARTASSCSLMQEQCWVVQWRWDLSHASKLCSNAKCVEGFSTVWEQVPSRNSWYFLVPGRLKNTVRMWCLLVCPFMGMNQRNCREEKKWKMRGKTS